jgi:UDP-N-acetylglucosamine--N-acetylmuramyl-(pentapeptide) pyrophosphoryl-undecaprenol N-acetylglucosamine transferase
MVKDNEAMEKIVPAITKLAADGQRQNELKNNITKLAITNADMKIAEEVLKAI